MRRTTLWLTFLLAGVCCVLVAADGKKPLFFGALKAIPPQTVPKGVKSLSAEACKDCHKDIYEQWKTTQHSKAMTGPIWRAMWTARNNPPFCVNCHAPFAQQRPSVLAGFKESGPLPLVVLRKPKFDPTLMREGVTCSVCHVRDGKILGPRQYEPEEEKKIPHPVAYDERFSKAEFCVSCHVFSFPRVRMDFASCDGDKDFFAFQRSKESDGEKATCQDCHMPLQEGVIGIDTENPQIEFPVRPYRAHIQGHLARTEEGLREAFALNVLTDKESYQPGETVKARVELTNALAGHMAPTSCGVRAVHVVVALVDEQGNKADEKTFRIGRAFEFPAYASETHDTRLKAEETRALSYSGHIPSKWAGRKVSLKVTLVYYLLSPRAAEQTAYPLEKAIIPVDEKSVPLTP